METKVAGLPAKWRKCNGLGDVVMRFCADKLESALEGQVVIQRATLAALIELAQKEHYCGYEGSPDCPATYGKECNCGASEHNFMVKKFEDVFSKKAEG